MIEISRATAVERSPHKLTIPEGPVIGGGQHVGLLRAWLAVLLVLGGSPSPSAIVARVADTIPTRRGAGVIARERPAIWYWL